MHNLVRG